MGYIGVRPSKTSASGARLGSLRSMSTRVSGRKCRILGRPFLVLGQRIWQRSSSSLFLAPVSSSRCTNTPNQRSRLVRLSARRVSSSLALISTRLIASSKRATPRVGLRKPLEQGAAFVPSDSNCQGLRGLGSHLMGYSQHEPVHGLHFQAILSPPPRLNIRQWLQATF